MANRKKIFMVLTNPFKPDPRVYKEARTLIGLGFDVTVVAWDREGGYKSFDMVDGIKVYRISIISRYASLFDFLVKLPLFYLNAMLYILKNRDGLYAIHANDFDTAPLAFFISRILGVKFIFDIHDLYYTRISLLEEQEKDTILRKILRRTEILFAKLSDSVITVSRSIGGKHKGLKEFLVNSGVPPDKIYVVWNAPDPRVFPRVKRHKHRGIVVGYIGTIRSISNFIPLFEIAKENMLLRIIFVGSGPLKDEIRELLSIKYPNIRVDFIESVPYEKVSEYYTLCDVIYSVYPMTTNIKMAIAVKMLESIIMGIPVIVNKDTLMEDFVNIYKCGVAVDMNVGSIKNALDKIKKIRPPTRLRDKWTWDKNRESIRKAYS
ncbi:glycosyltransferase family 4 protein [Pyrococcus abyssi]|uniref:Glycosyltransferase, family 1 n=1 Tax=Pyrococcus abyssi (strain GE5 / Orsay) TaxID=272844 RepID=Q9UZI9_PYRAB|nr:glycosyltransferase family 4 protein [Pyrococcus abyssi]CAB50068.1 Putative glycosyltransferase, family 1 [Pyrococcus abyssi GE5]CCE70574.1 TPA: LPS biosynthesis rfbu related protein [Pyrococcus abyssi GE5]